MRPLGNASSRPLHTSSFNLVVDGTATEKDYANSTVSLDTQASSLKSVKPSLSVSGTIYDPTDATVGILYSWDGHGFDMQETFAVASDGLATSAQYNVDATCDVIHGIVHTRCRLGTFAIEMWSPDEGLQATNSQGDAQTEEVSRYEVSTRIE